MPNQHTVPNPNGGWDVKGAGNKRATKHFDKQADAYSYAQNIARNQQTEALLHGRDGRIRARESYGNDPIPPRDKEH